MLQIKLFKINFIRINFMKYKCINIDVAPAIFYTLLVGWAWSQ